MFDALKRFTAKNTVPPSVLFILRDGLSDGEFAKVGDEEIQDVQGTRKMCRLCIFNSVLGAIDEAWQHLSNHPKPKVTYIVVGKRFVILSCWLHKLTSVK
jgi:eukaryotic translation initiation factor 2C